MSKADVVRRIKDAGVIAVVRAASAPAAVQLAEAVQAGGLPIVEITLTVPDALQAIAQLARAYGDEVLVGAGSVLDAEAARECIGAGARFVVSPVLKLGIVGTCRERNVVAIPGALTPTEIQAAAAAGADLIKVFPVNALGGAAYVKSLKAPMPHLDLVPTGGVTLATAGSYILAGAAAVGAGADLTGGGPRSVTAAARAYVEAVRAARREASPAPLRATSLS